MIECAIFTFGLLLIAIIKTMQWNDVVKWLRSAKKDSIEMMPEMETARLLFFFFFSSLIRCN